MAQFGPQLRVLSLGLFHHVLFFYYSIVWMYHSLYTHLPIEEHLGCFQVLAIINKADINIQVHVFPWLFPLGKHQGAWLLDCKVRTFSFVRNYQTVFQSGCSILHFHQQCMSVPTVHILASTWCCQGSRLRSF